MEGGAESKETMSWKDEESGGPRESLSRHFSIPSANIFHRFAVPNPLQFFHHKARILLLIGCCFAIAACVNQPANGRVSQDQISLNQAQRSRADAKAAIGYFLSGLFGRPVRLLP
jgi:hypothetical protein